MTDSNTWKNFDHECPSAKGSILPVMGIGRKDTYNVALFEDKNSKILAFRAEQRRSFAWHGSYHPMVYFAVKQKSGWQVTPDIPPFDMMEDPFFVSYTQKGKRRLIFGGVRIRREVRKVIPCTEFYQGNDIASLVRQPFLVVDNMKDIRLMQLPNDGFLLCRRPWGKEFGRGKITLHLIDSLDQVNSDQLKTLAILDAGPAKDTWAGINDMYLLEDKQKTQWVGLLGHVAFENKEGLHYAACTYKIRLKDLLDDQVRDIAPQVIASRNCFAAGPAKRKTLRDVVFPGHLEYLENNTYRLWAGLSDARIGTLEVPDPFRFAR